MLENPNDSSSTTKRYAPPNQRNRSLTKRKSGSDRIERMNSYGSEGEKNLGAISRNASSDYGSEGNNFVNYNSHYRLIPLQGCCKSEAPQILNDRWKAAINALNDPSLDAADKPIMYSGSSAPAWGSSRLPHQVLTFSLSLPVLAHKEISWLIFDGPYAMLMAVLIPKTRADERKDLMVFWI